MKTKTEKGITLIALVITIIVLLILAGVSISMLSGDNGIIQQATSAKSDTEYKSKEERIRLAAVDAMMKGNDLVTIEDKSHLEEALEKQGVADVEVEGDKENGYTLSGEDINLTVSSKGEFIDEETTDMTPVSIEDSFVGYYANFDDDKEPEGIIYIDFAKSESARWGGVNYTIVNKTTGLKDYYISDRNYPGPFGDADVLKIVPNKEGEDRFLVMALTDIANSCDIYDENKLSNLTTKTGIGEGIENTRNMISSGDGKAVLEEIPNGWFVPSTDEWAAFANNLGVETATMVDFGPNPNPSYKSLGLSGLYWSSSVNADTESLYYCTFDEYDMYSFSSNNIGSYHSLSYLSVRLSSYF